MNQYAKYLDYIKHVDDTTNSEFQAKLNNLNQEHQTALTNLKKENAIEINRIKSEKDLELQEKDKKIANLEKEKDLELQRKDKKIANLEKEMQVIIDIKDSQIEDGNKIIAQLLDRISDKENAMNEYCTKIHTLENDINKKSKNLKLLRSMLCWTTLLIISLITIMAFWSKLADYFQ